jgi:hypothetical protein
MLSAQHFGVKVAIPFPRTGFGIGLPADFYTLARGVKRDVFGDERVIKRI